MTSDRDQCSTDLETTFGQSDVVPLSHEDATVQVLTGAVQGLWEVVNQLTRLRRTRRKNYRVTIFGSARLAPGTPAYDAVRQLAAELTALGCDIVTGGGPGLMRAANEGAASVDPSARQRSMGVRIALPFEQEVNPFVGEVYEGTRPKVRLTERNQPKTNPATRAPPLVLRLSGAPPTSSVREPSRPPSAIPAPTKTMSVASVARSA